MLEIRFTSKFKKDFKKYRHDQLFLTQFNLVINLLLTAEPLPKRYKEHKLIGDYQGFYECHIRPDLLLLYFYEESCLVLVRVGSHSELFR